MAYPCPCCGYKTISKQPPGTYEICPICCWEDSYTDKESERSNDVGLWQAQKNFDEFGACEERWLDVVRAATDADERTPEFKPLYLLEDEIVDAIRTAFADVTKGISLRQADVWDNYGTDGDFKQAGKLDTDTNWQEVPDERLEVHGSSLSFLTPHSFKYYIPAFMIWTLKNFRTDYSGAMDDTLRSLTPPKLDPKWDYEFKVENLEKFPYDCWRREQLERFAKFEHAQSKAVYQFLRYMAAHSCFDCAKAAIARYWWQFAEDVDTG